MNRGIRTTLTEQAPIGGTLPMSQYDDTAANLTILWGVDDAVTAVTRDTRRSNSSY